MIFIIDRVAIHSEPWAEKLVPSTKRLLPRTVPRTHPKLLPKPRGHSVTRQPRVRSKGLDALVHPPTAVVIYMADVIPDPGEETRLGEQSGSIDNYSLVDKFHHHLIKSFLASFEEVGAWTGVSPALVLRGESEGCCIHQSARGDPQLILFPVTLRAEDRGFGNKPPPQHITNWTSEMSGCSSRGSTWPSPAKVENKSSFSPL